MTDSRLGFLAASTYTVTGNYCATDANPETDAAEVETTETGLTREEAETLLLWYPGGRIEAAA